MTTSGTLAVAEPATSLADSEDRYEVVDGKRVSSATAVPIDDSDGLYEVVDGKRVELPPMGAREIYLTTDLAGFLWSFVRSQRLGRVVTEMLFLLDADLHLQRRPDVAFVSYARWPRERPVPAAAAWEVVPNLAVEVVSPTNTAFEVLDKVREYFQTGVQRVWVVYPHVEQVYVYSSPASIRVIERLRRTGRRGGAARLPPAAERAFRAGTNGEPSVVRKVARRSAAGLPGGSARPRMGLTDRIPNPPDPHSPSGSHN